MTSFERLFGVKPDDIRQNCLISPFMPKRLIAEFKVKNFRPGRLYGAGSAKEFSLIQTGLGACLTGDAVLYLKDTPCKRIILFGSCGLTRQTEELGIGSMVSPKESGADESFTDMLLSKTRKICKHHPDSSLLKLLHDYSPHMAVKDVSCRTVGSLKIEAEMIDELVKDGVQVVDMESSALFAAAKYTGIPAVALFYVNDIVNERPFYLDKTADEKAALGLALNRSFELLWTMLTENV